MRIIKFRVWHKKEKKMIYSTDKDFAIRNNISSGEDEKYPEVFMQYIGLKDKNGKEIYEGDTVKKQSLSKKYVIGVIEYNTNNACFIVRVSGGYDFIRWGTIKEVIGNIYENPELLKGGD